MTDNAMVKYTVCDGSGAPVRVVYLPAGEIENQLQSGETARVFESADMPDPLAEFRAETAAMVETTA